MTNRWPDAGFGIYIHWPFCEAKCPYCDFNSHVSATIDQDTWRNAYLKEIERCAKELPDRIVRSVFFGGGTPSLMDPSLVDDILGLISKKWRLVNAPEITLEANPSSVEADRFKGYKAAGVNRVSLGVQALNDDDLKRLGRLHNVKDAQRALDIAQHTFNRVSFDLIYARQDQSLLDWETELTRALNFGFSHMSLYQLTIEGGTAFGARHARGALRGLPDEDLSADMYDLTLEMCQEAGVPMYEVSNYAHADAKSEHNLIYWRGGEYLGIGPGAHGRIHDETGQRWATHTHLSPTHWLHSVQAGSGELERELLTPDMCASEYVMMGLRLREGISLNKFNALAENAIDKASLDHLSSIGAIKYVDGNLVVEKQYVKVLNSVAAELLRN
ncbi:MAG: radical SAM family heme chaperone HemW [Pseudomonadota bacterium]